MMKIALSSPRPGALALRYISRLAAPLALGWLIGALVPAFGETTSLRPVVTVTGSTLRVGDLFSGAGVHAGEIVAPAPALGARAVFDASWLAATAQAHGLTWQPSDDSVSTEVTRAAAQIDQADITRQLLRQIAPGNENARLLIDGRVTLSEPVGAGSDIAIDNLQFDPSTGLFSADLRAAADDSGARPVHVTGRVRNVVEVPTLARPMMPGDVVGAGDIAWVAFDIDGLPAGEVMDAQGLIGRTPRRPLRAGEPLRPVDLEVPVLVRRNDAVLIVLEVPGMSLTVEGKALDDGGKGELIRVMNTQSNRILDATVLADDEVGVGVPGETPPSL